MSINANIDPSHILQIGMGVFCIEDTAVSRGWMERPTQRRGGRSADSSSGRARLLWNRRLARAFASD